MHSMRQTLGADDCATNAIMRREEASKPIVWQRQECYLDEVVAGRRRNKTWPSRVHPLPPETRLKVIAKTVAFSTSVRSVDCGSVVPVFISSKVTPSRHCATVLGLSPVPVSAAQAKLAIAVLLL